MSCRARGTLFLHKKWEGVPPERGPKATGFARDGRGYRSSDSLPFQHQIGELFEEMKDTQKEAGGSNERGVHPDETP